jgi:iron(III) transport system ATP-binding protein
MSTAIEIQSLTKAFPALSGGGKTFAVDDVSLSIPAGELFFLLGPSGCGKTTLLRMIAGFIEPTQGLIAFNGKDVTFAPPNSRNTGMVFQSYALWPHMTVAQNVAFGLEVRKIPSSDRARRVQEALAAVQMDHLAARRPNQLSGGQQQRVALARALVIRPDVLLLDEPLSNLDAKLRIELRSEIRRVCKESGITTIYVTHDQKEALSMADRIAIMDKGKAVQIGKPAALYRQPASRFVAEFLGETNILPATISGRASGSITLNTAAGPLTAKDTGELQSAKEVLVSIRPEAVRLSREGLPATVQDHTYLGEILQRTLKLPSGQTLRSSSINPLFTDDHPQGQPTHWTVDPIDVVLLPAS